MERVRPPRTPDDAASETIGPLPGTHSLPELLDAVRSPAVLKEDVDALLRGLARPLAEGESARARADLLLSLIESPDVGDLQGHGELTVRAAAVQALLDLGYPYALEISPEALAEARGSGPELKLPIPGLIATLAGFLTQSVQYLPPVLAAMDRRPMPSDWIALVVLLAPTSMAVLGGLLRIRGLLKAGLVTMGITGVIWMLAFFLRILETSSPLTSAFTYVSLVAGLSFLLGTYLLRPSAWLGKDASPQAEEPPPTET